MLDMGFLPDIRRVLRHIPTQRQTLFFSATMPPPIAALAPEMLKNPATINLQRQAAPAIGHHAGGLSGAAGPEAGAAASQLLRAGPRAARRSSSRAPSTARTASPSYLLRSRHRARRASTATARRRSAREALAGFKAGKYPRAGGDRHRGARHRRRGARPRRQLRRADGAGGLHPPRRPHRPRRDDRRRVHVRRAGGGDAICARSSARSAARCRASRCPTSTTRRRPAAKLEVPLARADRGDPCAQGRGTRPRQGQRRPARPSTGKRKRTRQRAIRAGTGTPGTFGGRRQLEPARRSASTGRGPAAGRRGPRAAAAPAPLSVWTSGPVAHVRE